MSGGHGEREDSLQLLLLGVSRPLGNPVGGERLRAHGTSAVHRQQRHHSDDGWHMLSRRGGGQVNAGVAEAVRECGDGGYLVWRCKLPARWRRANRKGQALVELAFVTVVLAIILLGIIELFSIYSSRNNLSDASRAGDRLASLNYGDTAINNTIMRMLGAAGLNTVHGSTCDITRIEIYDANPD